MAAILPPKTGGRKESSSAISSQLSASGIVLLSASPRRQDLLRRLGLEFTIEVAGIDEETIGGATPVDLTARVAAAKAETLRQPGLIAIAADTTVVSGVEILGKPRTSLEAAGMLRRLRGRAHQVLTAIAVNVDGHTAVDVVSTEVHMRAYTDEELTAYVASGDPLDKAGSYAIQHRQFHPVSYIRGCYQNVAGLPLCHLCKRLLASGVTVPILPPPVCRVDLAQWCPVALFSGT